MSEKDTDEQRADARAATFDTARITLDARDGAGCRRIVGAVAYRDTVASPAGDIPGFASFRGLAVAPDAQRLGLGRTLVT